MFEASRKRSAMDDPKRSGKRRQSSPGLHIATVQSSLLTLPRVGLSCRDPYCQHKNHHHHHHHPSYNNNNPFSQQGHSMTLPKLPPQSTFRIESEVGGTPGEFWNQRVVKGNVRSIFDASTLELGPSSKRKTADTLPPHTTTQLATGYGFNHGGLTTLDFSKRLDTSSSGDVEQNERQKNSSRYVAPPEIHQQPQHRKRSGSSGSSQGPEFPRGYYETVTNFDGASSEGGHFPPRFSFPPVPGSSSSRQGSLISSRSTRAAAALKSIDENFSSRSASPAAVHDRFSTDFSHVPPMKLPTYCTDCTVNGANLPHPGNFIAKDDPQNLYWQQNYSNFPQPTLRRDSSFISCGGFTLNGTGHGQVNKHKMRKFCSSHKIALVVSTFSLLVTVGLVITLLLMKKKGMMEAM